MSNTDMVDNEEEEQPRRGSRARKQIDRFDPSVAKGKKKVLEDSDDEEDEDERSEEDAPLRNNKRVANGVKKSKPKKPRRSAIANGDAEPHPEGEGLKTDSPWFTALLSAEIALEPLVQEWVENYQDTAKDETSEKAAVQELVLFFIRCCGLGANVDEDEAMDVDGVVDVLERIQDEAVNVSTAAYPLTSKVKTFKPFRGNIDTIIENFIRTIAQTPILFDTPESTQHSTPLLPLLLTWLHSMSSSPLRPIRHTSTYIALKINSALCDVASEVSQDLSLKQRQKETEAKKGASAAIQKRVREAEAKVKEAHARKVRIEELLKENFDVLYVHRVRDFDSAIRTDCFKELGIWVKKFPEKFVSTSYLNYLTRGCNDPSPHARLETVKAFSHLFSRESFINSASTVVLRLASRLVEMALRDIDLSVRVNAVHVITLIDKTGILQDEDEEQRERVARLIFDNSPRVRKAVSGFVHNLWTEKAEKLKSAWSGARPAKKKRANGIDEEMMDSYLNHKALASLLVDTYQALDQSEAGTSKQSSISHARALAVVEALWNEFDQLSNWQQLVDYLLLDHSADDMWLLTEDEESFMLQVLIACIQHDEKDEDQEERTKTLINILPRLFAKHQGDALRMTGVLSIPEHMNLGLYLDMRKNVAYDSLWDDVTKQFLQFNDSTVVEVAMKTINHLCSNSSMKAANDAKWSELQDAVFSSLRDVINGEDVSTMAINEDSIATLEAVLLRLIQLTRSRDLVDAMEDVEGGQSSGWEIVCAFAERGELGYKEEAKIVEQAMQLIFLHMAWMCKQCTPEDADDETTMSAFQDRRDRAVEIFRKLALERSNAPESVRRQAFICFLNLHILFSAKMNSVAGLRCPLIIPDETQHRIGGTFQAAVDRFASDRDSVQDDGEEEPLGQAQNSMQFLSVVGIFVASIRCGILEIDHAKEALAHYGRFDPAYDAVVKKLVDVLRDEGIYNRQADTVQHVAGAALQDSFNIFLDSEDEDPTATIALAKLVATAFVINGNHFSVLKQIHPSDVCDFHIQSIDWLFKRVAAFVNQERTTKNKDAKARAQQKRLQVLSFFRALVLLLGPVTGRDAVRIKSHLERAVDDAGAPVTANKGWDAYRSYEKRLVVIASKDPNVKMASQRVAAEAKKKQVEEEMEATDDEEEPVRSQPTQVYGDDPGSPTPSAPSKRSRDLLNGDEDEEGENGFDPDARGPSLDDLDFDLDLDLPEFGSQFQRERSASLQPPPKKRRTIVEV